MADCIYRTHTLEDEKRCCRSTCEHQGCIVSDDTCNDCYLKQETVVKSDAAQIKELIERALKFIELPAGSIHHNSSTQDNVFIGENNFKAGIHLLKEALKV
jgi:hypothetical protein